MPAPLDPVILEALRSSPVGPVMDKPVDQILRDMGLPPLPLIPVPPEFPVPTLDLAALVRPLTDLASTFGTGNFPSAPEVDPVQVLSQVSSVMETATQVGASALQLAAGLWQGQGAEAAAVKQAQLGADSTAVGIQSAQTSLRVAEATGSVSRGAFTMTAIITKYLTSVAMAAPFLGTGAGQVFLAASTAETMAEALACIAQTRGELGVHSAQLTATGAKVPVTDAPSSGDATQLLSQAMQIVPGLLKTVASGAKAFTQTASRPLADTTLAQHTSALDLDDVPLGAGPRGTVAFSTAGGPGGPAGPGPRPLAPWPGGTAPGSPGSTGPTATSSPSPTGSSPAVSPGRGASPGFLPTGGAGAMARGAGDSVTSTMQAQLASSANGNEMVGETDTATPPVIGAETHPSAPEFDGPPPDKALIL